MRKLIFFISAMLMLNAVKAQVADTNHLLFRIGSNFDFMNSSISFNRVYGELRYKHDRLVPIGSNGLYFGLDVGGFSSRSVSSVNNNFISNRSFVDPVNPYIKPDTLRVITQTIKSKQTLNFNQLSLFFNPMIVKEFTTTDSDNIAFRIGVGPYLEMYRPTSYIKYSDTSVLRQDTMGVPVRGRFVPTNFYDSVGTATTYGYLGVSLSVMLYTTDVIFNLKGTIGRVITGNNGNEYYPTRKYYSPGSNGFYLVEGSIMEPRSKISVHANIRGLLPNYAPVFGVYATKTFDIARLYEAITQ